jgi:hypothetical protein
MFRRQDEVVRVGIGVVLAAALAGLLVLLFHGSASPSELTSAEQEEIDRAALMLLRCEIRSADERVAEAESMLRRERDSRLGELVSSIAETGWRGMTGASPTSLAKDGYRIARRAYSWLGPSRTEAQALALIEPEVEAGTHNERLLRLYERLHSRETAKRVSELVESAEDAISSGDAGGARRAIDRIERIQPDSDDLPELKSELDDLLQAAA